MRVVLVSTYELGRQPFGLASPAAWLRDHGFEVLCVDLSRDPFNPDAFRGASLVAFFLPMHTATRLAGPVVSRVRALEPAAHLCAYGLYAPPNEEWLRGLGIATTLGGESEQQLLALALRLRESTHAAVGPGEDTRPGLPRLRFRTPDRTDLPRLPRYATLRVPGGTTRTVGYTEASRGCKHRCRHCPVVPIYNGQFRVVQPEVVLADIRQQVEVGATHITFGDPDFLNGPAHARRVVESVHREFPGLTYDVTIKVEHLLAHADLLALLRATGCLFVTTAVESLDDRVLAFLRKGHTRADFLRVVALCREAGLVLNPTFVAFTPWTTRDGYVELLDAIENLELVPNVAPIQLAIRLLVPRGSRLLELEDIQRLVGPFDHDSLSYPWHHPDPAMDALQSAAERLVAASTGQPRAAVFENIRTLASHLTGVASQHFRRKPDSTGENTRPLQARIPRTRTEVPYLDEPWYC